MLRFIYGFVLVYFTLIITSCSVNKAKTDDSLKSIFDKYQSNGCFAFLNNASGEITVYNAGYDTIRFSPGGSFQIPLSLFALQKGTVPDELQLIRDTSSGLSCSSLSDAFINHYDSCFSMIAQKLGKPVFQSFLDSLHYGNAQSGEDFTHCWNNNSLRISPDEQLGLMKKLYFSQLPYRESVQKTVCNMMQAENSNLYSLSWKVSQPVRNSEGKFSSWTTGWIEENRHVYFFVTYAETAQAMDSVSSKISRDILSAYEFFQGKK